jgi:hypothetical protein
MASPLGALKLFDGSSELFRMLNGQPFSTCRHWDAVRLPECVDGWLTSADGLERRWGRHHSGDLSIGSLLENFSAETRFAALGGSAGAWRRGTLPDDQRGRELDPAALGLRAAGEGEDHLGGGAHLGKEVSRMKRFGQYPEMF